MANGIKRVLSLIRPVFLGGLLFGFLAIAILAHTPVASSMDGMSHASGSMKTTVSPECKMLCVGMLIDKIKESFVIPELEVDPTPPLLIISASALSTYVAIIIGLYSAKKYLKVPIYEMNGVLRI